MKPLVFFRLAKYYIKSGFGWKYAIKRAYQKQRDM